MAKSKIQAKIQEQVVEHIEEKQTELKNKANAQTVWYKKIPYYVAALLGGGVIQVVNTYGDQIYDYVINFIGSLF